MSDEERRALEREARYSKNLSNFLTCMREGHSKARQEYVNGSGGITHRTIGVAFNGPIANGHNWAWPCERCGLVVWNLHGIVSFCKRCFGHGSRVNEESCPDCMGQGFLR